MKVVAARAIAALVREETPDEVLRAYRIERLRFGPEYIIPKPFDSRVVLRAAPAVAQAAIDSGVAQRELNMDAYRQELERRLGGNREVVRLIMAKAAESPRRILFPEGEQPRVLRACHIVAEEGIAEPIVIGDETEILAQLQILGYEQDFLCIVDPAHFERRDEYAEELFRLRQRKGLTLAEARSRLRHSRYLGPMMVRMGDADGLVGGLLHHFSDTVRPALQIIGLESGAKRVAGLYMMVLQNEVLFFADPVINIDPSAEEVAEIAIQTANMARCFDVEPRVAMLSFSTFGSSDHPQAEKMRRATEMVRAAEPALIVEGEMQADLAFLPETLSQVYPFSQLCDRANVLIFPDLTSANIAYRLVNALAGAEAVGPILMGLDKPVHLMPPNSTVEQITQLAAIAVVDAQIREANTQTDS
jgi:malate dehydrogenase (oxaloacetate-decarboxylating)(NADP+)